MRQIGEGERRRLRLNRPVGCRRPEAIDPGTVVNPKLLNDPSLNLRRDPLAENREEERSECLGLTNRAKGDIRDEGNPLESRGEGSAVIRPDVMRDVPGVTPRRRDPVEVLQPGAAAEE